MTDNNETNDGGYFLSGGYILRECGKCGKNKPLSRPCIYCDEHVIMNCKSCGFEMILYPGETILCICLVENTAPQH